MAFSFFFFANAGGLRSARSAVRLSLGRESWNVPRDGIRRKPAVAVAFGRFRSARSMWNGGPERRFCGTEAAESGCGCGVPAIFGGAERHGTFRAHGAWSSRRSASLFPAVVRSQRARFWVTSFSDLRRSSVLLTRDFNGSPVVEAIHPDDLPMMRSGNRERCAW